MHAQYLSQAEYDSDTTALFYIKTCVVAGARQARVALSNYIRFYRFSISWRLQCCSKPACVYSHLFGISHDYLPSAQFACIFLIFLSETAKPFAQKLSSRILFLFFNLVPARAQRLNIAQPRLNICFWKELSLNRPLSVRKQFCVFFNYGRCNFQLWQM